MQIKIYLANYITVKLLYDCFKNFTITDYDSFENSIKIKTKKINYKQLEAYNMVQGEEYRILEG